MLFDDLVRLRNVVREGWSGIDVQLRRRTDLMPNLVEAVKGYAAHERRLITGRRQAGRARNVMRAGLCSMLRESRSAV